MCLAGFMRLVGSPLLEAFPHRVLNIHPSLLPAFPGLDAQRQALEHGVRVTGATVHLVTPELDNGPIVLQAAVPVLDDDTVETLSARILIEEHRIYPEAIRLVLNGGWSIDGRRFRSVDGRDIDAELARRAAESDVRGPLARDRLRRPLSYADCGSGISVRIATSGGQLILTGTYTVPTPRLTNIVVWSRRAVPARTGNFCFAMAPIPGSTTWPPWV